MNLTDLISDPARRAALAAACNTSPDYLWQVATSWNGRRASPALAQAIERESKAIDPDGVGVSKAELRPDIWGEQQAEAA